MADTKVKDVAVRAKPRSSTAGFVTRSQLQKIRDVFNVMDSDNTGSLCFAEVCQLWAGVFPGLSQDEIETEVAIIWRDLDNTGDNEVTLAELLGYVTGCQDLRDGDIEELFELPLTHRIGRPNTLREWIWAVMEQSAAEAYNIRWLKRANFVITVISQTAIVGSIILMVVESLPASQNHDGKAGTQLTFKLEHACMGCFSLELLLRAISTPHQRRFWLNGWTLIDFFSILPYYLELSGALNQSSNARSLVVLRILRLARLVRVLRVIKLGRHFEGVQILVVALQRSSFALTWLAAILLMAMTLFASLMFSVEKEDATFDFDKRIWYRNVNSTYVDRGQPLLMQSIPDAMWWAMVTLTTVGYGDVYPVTSGGKFVGSLTMFVGVLVVAFPVTILCNVFQEVYTEFLEAKRAKALNANLKPILAENLLNPHFGESGTLSPVSAMAPDSKGREDDNSNEGFDRKESKDSVKGSVSSRETPVFTRDTKLGSLPYLNPLAKATQVVPIRSLAAVKEEAYSSPRITPHSVEYEIRQLKQEVSEMRHLLEALVHQRSCSSQILNNTHSSS